MGQGAAGSFAIILIYPATTTASNSLVPNAGCSGSCCTSACKAPLPCYGNFTSRMLHLVVGSTAMVNKYYIVAHIRGPK